MELEVCGKWMQRAKTTCVRGAGHGGRCSSAASAERNRAYQRVRREAGYQSGTPESRTKWRRKSRLAAYGLTLERYDQLLADQGNACAMCREPFKEGQRIVVDHDHSCCDTKLRSCGKCVRGLLCHPCNIALGQIELKSEMARAYLGTRPDQRAS